MALSVQGAFDTHVHAYPSLFPRLGDDWQIGEACQDARMSGIVLKSHHESTASRAYLLGSRFAELSVYGGIALNRFVGGLNPAAVEACLRTGGRIVWMPTIDAQAHADLYERAGGYREQEMTGGALSSTGPPIAIVRKDRLIDQVYEILDLVREHDAVLATGHLSAREVALLVREAGERGIERIVVTHPHFKVPGMSLEQIRDSVQRGAYIELTYCAISPRWAHATLDDYRQVIEAVGARHCMLSSDAGQRHNPPPPEALRLLMQGLYEKGVSEEALYRMAAENPRALVESR